MKKLLFVAVMSVSIFGTATAQSKIGYINTDELISLMPEAAKAQAQLQEYQAGLAQQYQDLTVELNGKDSAFVVDSVKQSPSIREIKRKELIELYQKVQNYQQDAQEQMQQKQSQVIVPIREKALAAITAVAKQNGYGYVFNEDNLLVNQQAIIF